MNYKLTFEDGSSGYLAHHGVKGMQWGVHNPETAARYASGERSNKTKRLMAKNERLSEEHRALYKNPKLSGKKATRESWRLSNKKAAINKRIYKSDAKDAGLLPDRKLAKSIGSGWTSLSEGLADNKKRVDKLLKNSEESDDRLFVSGSSKTQNKDSEYYRKKLPKEVRKELKGAMKSGSTILVGDAPGVDRQVQDYLNKKKYRNVEVYSPGTQARYKAGKDWINHTINDTKHEPGSKEWLAKKDVAMTNRATRGMAVVLDEGANATRRNVERLRSQGKDAVVYELSKSGKRKDRWVDSKNVRALE